MIRNPPTFPFLEEIVVDKGGMTYSGTFSVITYDLTGKTTFEAKVS